MCEQINSVVIRRSAWIKRLCVCLVRCHAAVTISSKAIKYYRDFYATSLPVFLTARYKTRTVTVADEAFCTGPERNTPSHSIHCSLLVGSVGVPFAVPVWNSCDSCHLNHTTVTSDGILVLLLCNGTLWMRGVEHHDGTESDLISHTLLLQPFFNHVDFNNAGCFIDFHSLWCNLISFILY